MKKNERIIPISSSFVSSNYVIKGDTGSGEAKLYVAPSTQENELNEFFNFTGDMLYTFDKNNLLNYLNMVKIEYAYQTINKYTNLNIKSWEKAKNYVDNCTSFQFKIEKFISEKRYYIRPTADEESKSLWNNCLRSLPLPSITNLKLTKDNNIITFNLDIKINKENKRDFNPKTSYSSNEFPFNRIVFGAPGTGKSHTLEKDANKILSSNKFLERVTFYQDYSYSKFFGTYKPVSSKKGINYEFVPGPFMTTYIKAMQQSFEEKPQPCILLIEEINRANPAATFGDIFQLLDRNSDNVSKYPISINQDVQNYLCTILGGKPSDYDKLIIPNNMYIWATMNSADQGVFPMDTAFKRRWSYEYIGINENESALPNFNLKLGTGNYEVEDIEWNTLRKAINKKLLDVCNVNEDKLIGPFFLDINIFNLNTADSTTISENFADIFKSKILMYLFEDAGKLYRGKLFEDTDARKYSSICTTFDEKGIYVFGDRFKEDYYDKV